MLFATVATFRGSAFGLVGYVQLGATTTAERTPEQHPPDSGLGSGGERPRTADSFRKVSVGLQTEARRRS